METNVSSCHGCSLVGCFHCGKYLFDFEHSARGGLVCTYTETRAYVDCEFWNEIYAPVFIRT